MEVQFEGKEGVKRLLACVVLIGLLTLLLVGPVHAADTPYTFTYHFNPENVCWLTGTMSFAPTVLGVVLVGGDCPQAPMTMIYEGPTLTNVSVTYRLTVSCVYPNEAFDVGIVGTLGGLPSTDLPGCTGQQDMNVLNVNSTDRYGTLLSGQQVNASVQFDELPQSQCFMCAATFNGTMTISGIDPPPPSTGVPQFPLGLLPLVALCVPALLILRRRTR